MRLVLTVAVRSSVKSKPRFLPVWYGIALWIDLRLPLGRNGQMWCEIAVSCDVSSTLRSLVPRGAYHQLTNHHKCCNFDPSCDFGPY
jgi:hypothetical protein